MGFGIMLIGCFLLLLGAFTTLAPFTYVVGSAVVLYSLKELIKQNKVFFSAMILSIAQLALTIVNLFTYVLSPSQDLVSTLAILLQICNLSLCIVLLTAIFLLAKEVELPSIQRKVIVAYIFAGIYFIAIVLANTAFRTNSAVMERISVIVFFTQLLYVILTLLVVANSYMRICYADDLNMDKKTGNATLDFLNDKLNYAMTPREKKDLEKNKGDKGDKK
ncbi:MAG: hypothetical protein IJW10_01315 [Clostridia bacterium]|nr:hypothetical protein [Clostridia bacterium]